MADKEKILNIMQNILVAYSKEKHTINTNNGILNEDYLNYHKRQLLKNAVSYMANDVVNVHQHYPHNDLSDVELTTDLVIFKRKDFDKLMNLIDNI
jgi:hypothetical protein